MSVSSSSQSSSHGGKATTPKEEPSSPTPSPSPSPSNFRSSHSSHSSTIEQPTLPIPESQHGLRARSNTSPDPHFSPSFSARLSSRTTAQSRQPPLQHHLPSTAVNASQSSKLLPTLAECPSEKPSAPIDIPTRNTTQAHVSRPVTPLTARAPQGEYFTSWLKTEPRISESLTPYYSSRVKNPSGNRDSSVAQRGSAPMNPRSDSSRYRPSSPLSSKTSVPLPSINSSQNPRRSPQSLKLTGLPKYHPANFIRGSSPAPPSTLSSRSVTSQLRPGRGSNAKQQLLQYQRDIINDTAKSSLSLASSNVTPNPNPPRLNPRKSPGGPMTPLILEGASDYLVAGSSSLPAGLKEGDGREFVERLVRRENERKNYPEARSGSVSPALSLSPAVSPAGGRG